MKRRASNRPLRTSPTFGVEALEPRRLMAGEPWGAFPKLIDQDLAVSDFADLTGAGTAVAVLDTGVDYRHPSLGGAFGAGHKVVAGYDFVDDDADPMDESGHGTSVAGVIAADAFVYGGAKYQGIAPAAKLIALRTDDGSDNIDEGRMEAALQWVIDHRAQYNIVAVNISTGEGHYATEAPRAAYADELATLKAAGVFICASSGNDGVSSPYGVEYPAADPSVYAVGAINVADQISTITERGAILDLLAPGEDLPMVAYDVAQDRHVTFASTGTSFASPHAAGMAALLKQLDPTLTPAQIMGYLRDGAVDNYDGDDESGPTTGLTYPRLNVRDALAAAHADLDDASEDNDSYATATTLTFTNDAAGLTGRALLLGDPDFYQFTLPRAGIIDFAFGASAAPTPSFQLRDNAHTQIRTLASGDAVALAAGTYFLRVPAPAATLQGAYWLSLEQTLDDTHEQNDSRAAATSLAFTGNDAEIDNLVLLASDDDYYRFDLAADADVDISLWRNQAGALPTVQLLDGAGASVATLSGDATATLLAGTYYLRWVATGTTLAGTYGMALHQTPDDARENNDTLGTATPLTFTGGSVTLSGLRLLGGDADYYSFDVAATSDVTVTLTGSATAGDLLDADGDTVAHLIGGHTARLAKGTYLVRLAQDESAAGTYALAVTAAPVGVGANAAASDMAYDSKGNLHVAYYDSAARNLKYAVKSAAGSWSDITTVDATAGAGRQLSLALDASDRPGIAYYESTAGDLRYARLRSDAWSIETLDTTGVTGRTPSLAFDSLSRPAISYYNATLLDLKFVSFDGTAWKRRTLDATGDSGKASSLVYDRTAKVFHLAYERTTGGLFRYARQTSSNGAWTFATVDDTSSGGGHISIALDKSRRAAFSYYDAHWGNLKFARFDGKAWRTTTVASTGTVGLYSTLTFGTDGKADIVYQNVSSRGIFAARGDIGAWSVKQVVASAGDYLSAATSPLTARQIVAWSDPAAGLLRFATR